MDDAHPRRGAVPLTSEPGIPATHEIEPNQERSLHTLGVERRSHGRYAQDEVPAQTVLTGGTKRSTSNLSRARTLLHFPVSREADSHTCLSIR